MGIREPAALHGILDRTRDSDGCEDRAAGEVSLTQEQAYLCVRAEAGSAAESRRARDRKNQAAGARLQKQIVATKFYEVVRRSDLQAQLDVLNLELLDAKQAYGRAQAVLHASV